jgi:hypothetical protein
MGADNTNGQQLRILDEFYRRGINVERGTAYGDRYGEFAREAT